MANSTQQKACLICDADEIDAKSLLGSLPACEMSLTSCCACYTSFAMISLVFK